MEEYKHSALPSSDDEADELLSHASSSADLRPLKAKRWSKFLLFLIFAGFILYTLTVVTITLSNVDLSCTGGPRILPNIVQDAIKYRPTTSYIDHNWLNDTWFGEPNEGLDHRWHELTRWADIRVPEDEVIRLGRQDEGVHFPDGGYFGQLTIHHNLHCLMRVHHHMYLDHYFPNITEEERALESEHTVHCLNVIKHALMCTADTTILTMRWLDFSPIPSANWSTPRACVDWRAIDGWARDHHVNPRAPGMMVHPKFGPVFDEFGRNNASRIGVVSMPH